MRTLGLRRFRVVDGKITYITKAEFDEIHKNHMEVLKMQEASDMPYGAVVKQEKESDHASEMQRQSALNNSTEESSDDEGPPQLSPPHLSEETAEGCVLYQPDSEMTESDESPSNEEEEELRDDNDTRQCRDDAPASGLLHTQEPCTKQKESVRLMWCKLCDTYYPSLMDLKSHIFMRHHQDPSRVNKWNSATWDLEIGKSLNPPSDNSDEEHA